MFSYKIVMLGDFGVGKTCLVHRFVDNSFSEDYISSIGVSMSRKHIINKDGVESFMVLWDTEGRTEFKQIFKQYLIGAKAFIIVADLTRPNTINSIKEHIELCQEVIKDAPISIALNKSDLEDNTPQSIEEIKSLSSNIISVHKTSAKSGDEVNEIFNIINNKVIQKYKS
jgi:small GTP-binding protein